MNRQQVVISIVKINRCLKILGYWQELQPSVHVANLDSQLVCFGRWAEGIYEFLLSCDDRKVFRLARTISNPTILTKYIDNCKQDLSEEILWSLRRYMDLANDFDFIDKGNRKGSQGDVLSCLPEGIDNEFAVKYLQKAVDAGLLDSHFQPTTKVSRWQLRMIAFAVGSLLHLPYRKQWVYFDKLWPLSNDNRISHTPIPMGKRSEKRLVQSIYHEVDFRRLLNIDTGNLHFAIKRDKETMFVMYKRLLQGKFVAKSISFTDFCSIFAPTKQRKPIRWLKEQNLLAYFVYNAFNKPQDKIWQITSCCFSINGKDVCKENTPE
jgi:hypothetical protein